MERVERTEQAEHMEMELDRETGFVRWFASERGYGFITRKDGIDVFVNYRHIVNDAEYKYLVEGQFVEFSVVKEPKGLAARRVVIID